MSIQATNNLPAYPAQGQQFWVQSGSHYCLGTGHSVGEVNSRSFTIRSEGKVTRHRLFEWADWLQQRMSEGIVRLAGRRLFSSLHPLPRSIPPSKDPTMAQPSIEISLKARDQRFLRGARDVLKNYTLRRKRPLKSTPELVRVEVAKGSRSYLVEFQSDWSVPPQCSCPDATHGGAARADGFCKHTIAAALKWSDLRCQLLDLLL